MERQSATGSSGTTRREEMVPAWFLYVGKAFNALFEQIDQMSVYGH
jgi:hypothetical protein